MGWAVPGRIRPALVELALGDEPVDRSYARQLGVRTPPFDTFDLDAVQAHHEAVYAAIPGRQDGQPLTDKGCPARYAIRRMAWDVLAHAWEMQHKNLSDLTGKASS